MERLELRLGRPVRLPLLLEQLRQPAGLEAVRLEEGVTLADEVVLLDDVGLCGVELADRFLELALEVGDGLDTVIRKHGISQSIGMGKGRGRDAH